MTAVEDPPIPAVSPPRRRPMRRVRIAGAAALAGLLCYVLLGLHFFVLAPSDPLPAHADVVLVLGGPTPERLATAADLLRSGRVGTVLISTPGPAYESLPECSEAHVICRAPVPSTTQGEARMLQAEALRHHWTSAIVTTQTAHLDRARLIVGRCFAGSISMLSSGEPPQGGWLYEYAYQTAATLKAWLVTNTC